jgi:hypothetical protein
MDLRFLGAAGKVTRSMHLVALVKVIHLKR